MKTHARAPFVEKAIAAIGSIASLVVHTILFIVSFLLSIFGVIDWQLMLLVLTTVVSLEAIYMAIFIQIAVNRNTEQLREVEEDIDEIQEDFEDIQEDIEEMSEDIEEMSEDIDEIQEDVEELNEDDDEEVSSTGADAAKERKKRVRTKEEMLEGMSKDIERLLKDLEELKAGE